GIEGVADQHRIGLVGVERAVGLDHELVGRQYRAAAQRQGLVEPVGLGRGDHDGISLAGSENEKPGAAKRQTGHLPFSGISKAPAIRNKSALWPVYREARMCCKSAS